MATRFGVRRVAVSGESMRPVLEPGDRLVVVSGPLPIRRGHIVALRDPELPGEPERMVVKRIESVHGDRVRVLGDRLSLSTDSRQYGPVPRASVVGRVVYRYAPPHRTGCINRGFDAVDQEWLASPRRSSG